MNPLLKEPFQRGFGTFPLTGEVLRKAMLTAIEAGYRTFDTAQGYGNEADTGAALAQSGLAAEQFCVITKVRPENFNEAVFLPSVEQSLRDLQRDRIDILLLHWPDPSGDVAPSLRLLQQARDRGLARHIGVSNYNSAMMRTAAGILHDAPVTNQVEFHPLLDQGKLLTVAGALGIPLSSYCSLARGAVLDYPVLGQIGARHGKSAAQVALRWILQQGVSLNTMSTKPANIRANFEIADFALTAEDMAGIDRLTATNLRIVDRDKVPFAPDWD